MAEARKDCFAYKKEGRRESCSALNQLYCRNENCKFYKTKKQQEADLLKVQLQLL